MALALLAVLLRLWGVRATARERQRLADRAVLRQYVRLPDSRWRWLRVGLLALGALALALASRGSAPLDVERLEEDDVETVLVLDASNSMLAEDLDGSRLDEERQLARALAARLPGRLAVVYFAGRGYVLSPLTTDVNAVTMFVDAVRPANVGLGGSALAAGLTQALDLLAGGENQARKAIVLFSDGEETVGQPVEDALRRAARSGVPVHAVGIGTTEGGPVPLTRDASVDPATAFERRGRESFLRGPDGEVVISRLDEATLRTIADATDGLYARGSSSAVGRLTEEIGRSSQTGDRAGLGATSLLLLFGFLALWADAFLFSRG
jgi:Ca-activated chloride channel family protein